MVILESISQLTGPADVSHHICVLGETRACIVFISYPDFCEWVMLVRILKASSGVFWPQSIVAMRFRHVCSNYANIEGRHMYTREVDLSLQQFFSSFHNRKAVYGALFFCILLPSLSLTIKASLEWHGQSETRDVILWKPPSSTCMSISMVWKQRLGWRY